MRLTMLVDCIEDVDNYIKLRERKLPIDSLLVCNREYAEKLRGLDAQLLLYIFEGRNDIKDIGIPTRQGAYGLPSPTIAITVSSSIELIRVLAMGGMGTIFLRKMPHIKDDYDIQRSLMAEMINISAYDDIEFCIVEVESLADMVFFKGMGIDHFLVSPELCKSIIWR